MKKTAIATLITAALTSATPAYASDVVAELNAMKARIAQLEAKLAEQQETIEQQAASPASAGGFADNVSVSGALEILASHSEEESGNSASDIEVDTFELAVEAQLNELVAVSSLLEYNSDDDGIELSEAYAVIGNDETPATLTVGKAPIPFAAINDAGWTSPLTDDFFDITEGMAMASFGTGPLAADVFIYNNDEGDSVNTYGLNLSLEAAEGLTLGAGYANDLQDDANDLTDLTSEAADAWRLNALLETGPFAFSAEFIEVDGSDFDPQFMALNAAYNTELFGAEGQVYLGYSDIDDSAADAERTVLGMERAFGENTSVVAEYVRDEDNSGAETDTLNLVLVTEF
ncbi:LbtU family siderophore porin [Neptuniibacter halophilus]|uniref:LbtU family siderophore porin n=1 Tax=Neptuniibacter halophilus TaxID=651666 RepID=UPI002573D3F6|nr:LbtU family siderophore porin [Neptuniibacter halophilus]